jgi:hypothetical protein
MIPSAIRMDDDFEAGSELSIPAEFEPPPDGGYVAWYM